MRVIQRCAAYGVIAIALLVLANALYLPSKALAAQLLLELAWQRTITSGIKSKPWPWADTSTIARISFPQHGEDFIVLAGSMGRSLAFAPGHLTGSRLPEQQGHMVISAHRDSHFAILEHVELDDTIMLESLAGLQKTYRVTQRRIVDSQMEQLLLNHDRDRLTLVTCYPFDALHSGGSLRLRIDAIAVSL